MPFTRPPLALTVLVVAAVCCSASAGEWKTDLEAAKQEAQRLDRPILVHFYATWCPPCMKMEKEVLHTRQVLDQIDSSVVAVLVDVGKHPELGRRFEVESLPTDLFLEPNGKHMVRMSGRHSIQEYTETIARSSTRYTDLVASRTPPKPSPEASPAATDSSVAPAKKASQEVMLLGYCPVTLWERRKWEKGSPQFAAEYQGQTYHMASAKDLEKFQENMKRYAPQLLGCDPVLMAKDDRAVAGSTRYGAFYDDELYLFTSDSHRKQFKANPDRFIREKVVFDVDRIEQVLR